MITFCVSLKSWYRRTEELWLVNFCLSSKNWYWRMEELWLVNFCLCSKNWYLSMEELWLINFCGSSQSWYRRMEDLFLGTEGWNYGSIVIYRESPMDWRSNICFAKFIVLEFKELVLMDWKNHSWLQMVVRRVPVRKRKFKLFGRSNIWLA